MNVSSRLAVVVSSDMTIKSFLIGHLRAWSTRCALSVFANSTDVDLLAQRAIVGELVSIPIERPVRLLADVRALWLLVRAFRDGQFNAVFSVTPKSGLLSMMAGFFAQVPVRIHIFTGQVWVTRRGVGRVLLKSIDRLTAALATHVLVDSESQRQFLIAERVVSSRRSTVLGKGSVSGVDVSRFKPDILARQTVRADLGLHENQTLLLFLGRLNHDKGVLDLARAFAALTPQFPQAHLLFVGPDEAGMRNALKARCVEQLARVHFVGFTNHPERYMAAADIFCLPSYREGFGSVVIEAAAAGLPTVASRIYGLSDAVQEGKTGLLHEAHDIEGLRACLACLLDDQDLCATMGMAARERALRDFEAQAVSAAYARYVFQSMGLQK